METLANPTASADTAVTTQPSIAETALAVATEQAVAATYLTDSPSAQPTLSEVEVGALFDRWNSSLRTLDAGQVVANYASASVLLPTLSDTPRFTDAAKLDYFRHFLAKRPIGMIDCRQISVGAGTAVDCGLYTFFFGATGDSAKARYTFTYAFEGGQWLITSHHSSLLPGQP